MAIFWDRNDARLLAVENRTTCKEDCELTDSTLETFLVHEEKVHVYGTQRLGTRRSALSISWPHIVVLNDGDEPCLECLLAEDFVSLDVALDQKIVEAMLNFRLALALGDTELSFQLLPIRSKQIWTSLCHTCIRTGNLEAALVCLGRSGDPCASRILRDQADPGDRVHKLGLLANHMGLGDVAEELYQKSERWDLLVRQHSSQGQWTDALNLAEKRDRVSLKRVHFEYAQHLERVGKFSDAIAAYEKADALEQISRMLSASSIEAGAYLASSKHAVHKQWRAEYAEAHGLLEEACALYTDAGDFLSTVRIKCYQNKMREARDLAESSGNAAANYHLAQHFESLAKFSDAVAHYAKAGCFAHAIRLAKNNGLVEDMMHLAIRSGQQNLQEDAAMQYAKLGLVDKAIALYLRAGKSESALELCLETQKFEFISEIALKIASGDSSGSTRGRQTLIKCAELLRVHNHHKLSCELLTLAGEHSKALDACVAGKIEITETMTEKMDPATVADACMNLGQYALASKKYILAGNKLGAMKALLRLGDVEQIVFFAGVSGPKNRDIYVLAANFLQSCNWRENSSLIKHIISFYSKARSYDHLSGFFESCAQLEIDDYSNYSKVHKSRFG